MSEEKMSDEARAYEKRCNRDLEGARQAFATLRSLEGDRTVTTVFEPLNDLWMIIDRVLNTAQLLRNVHPDESLRDVADGCEQEFSKLVTDIGLSRPVYDAVSAVDVSGEDAVTQRYAEHVLRDFRRAGVDKDPETRDAIRKLREELVLVGQGFGKNIREDVRAIKLDSVDELDGLPQDYVEAHPAGPDGKITLTTDYPDIIPYMTYASIDSRRLELYTKFRKRGCPNNESILLEMLDKRHELARLLGHRSWADYVTEDKMIKTAGAARDFINKVADISEVRAKHDYDELREQLRQIDPDAREVGDWQKSFLEEQLKREKYDFDSQAVRAYFPYDRVRQGLLDITAKIFDLRYERIEPEVWHPSVDAYEVYSDGDLVGRFFLDMHPREGKYKHAAAFPLQSGVADRQIPEAALVCNFPGGDGTLCLMEHDQVETFFHEFGHLLHHILGGRHRWIEVSGFNVEWDFVEAPSQLLEEWAWDVAALRTFARNEKEESIPTVLVDKMRRARDFGKGTWARHQMFYAAISLEYYDRDPDGIDTTTLMKELQAKYSPFEYVSDTFFQYSFGHLDGYSAMYYTYMWSLVIAKDLFSVFQEKGLMNPEPARRYKKTILETGGSKDAEEMVHDFLGRNYSFEAFARWLDTD
ncbi:M3 family metallopeptidase [Myxococcota bacterium]